MQNLPQSNFGSKYNYVIQAYDNTLDKWTDSKYGGKTYFEAQRKEFELRENESFREKIFMSPETKTRVARANNN